jgi:hypothetical protein
MPSERKVIATARQAVMLFRNRVFLGTVIFWNSSKAVTVPK